MYLLHEDYQQNCGEAQQNGESCVSRSRTNRRAEGVGSGETQVDGKRAQHLRTTPLAADMSTIFAPDLPEPVLDWTGSGEGVGRGNCKSRR